MEPIPDFSKFTELDWRRLQERQTRELMVSVGNMADAYRAMWTDHRTMLAENDRLKGQLRALRETVDMLVELVIERYDQAG